MAGTAVFCTDVLKLNIYFTHGEDIVIIEPDAELITQELLYYYNHVDQLYQLSKRGQKKFLEVFDFKKYMTKKATILTL